MKRIFLFAIAAFLAVGFYWFKPDVYAQPAVVSEAERQRILAETVQIRLKAPLLVEAGHVVIAENNGKWRTVEVEARGLGTLVQWGGQLYVVTHDHWGGNCWTRP